MFFNVVKPFESGATTVKDAIKATFSYSIDVAGYYALAVTIALILILTGIGMYVKNKKPEEMPMFKKFAIGLIIGYSIAIIFTMGSLKIAERVGRGKKFFEDYDTGGVAAWGLAADSASGQAQLYIYTFLLIALFLTLAFVFGKKMKVDKTKSVVYGAIMIALSFALSYVKFFSLPQGGSITFASLVPLMLYSYMFGIRRGLGAGFIYGVLQFLQGPYFIHPMQFLLDYLIAFSAIGLTGIFKERNVFKGKLKILNFVLGAFVAVFLRYMSSVVAGIFVWGSYIDENVKNLNAVAWSFLYNSFAFADLAIALVAGIILLQNKSFVTTMEKTVASITIDDKSSTSENAKKDAASEEAEK